ncbi:hypothetical protein F2Q70_00010069 [Brassica cretica]|uniref:Uncharacterized protein n=1 Tax=Brassica cretica TaxID=69181 RepID=A0A8S9J7U8_BRACR|nr:hypothetical protein F2Q68_00003057 [Brassica cretica]KAF2611062.1 hypothetical protein F2Q70_00010069 [Brassica cretica]
MTCVVSPITQNFTTTTTYSLITKNRNEKGCELMKAQTEVRDRRILSQERLALDEQRHFPSG